MGAGKLPVGTALSPASRTRAQHEKCPWEPKTKRASWRPRCGGRGQNSQWEPHSRPRTARVLSMKNARGSPRRSVPVGDQDVGGGKNFQWEPHSRPRTARVLSMKNARGGSRRSVPVGDQDGGGRSKLPVGTALSPASRTRAQHEKCPWGIKTKRARGRPRWGREVETPSGNRNLTREPHACSA